MISEFLPWASPLFYADCTTERTQLNRGGTRVGSTCERAAVARPRHRRSNGCGFLMQRKIVLHRALQGTRVHINRSAGGDGDVNIAGVVVEGVFTAGAKVTIVRNVAGDDDTLRSDAAEVDASNLHNAHLHVVTINGPVNLKSISGGHIEVLSSGGAVSLDNVDAQRVSVSTTTGNISYDGDFGSGGEYSFNNHSGNIDVTVPASASIDVDARSLQGSVQNDLPLHQKSAAVAPAVTGSSYGRSFAGTSNSGSSSVELRSFSGTIRVKKR